MNRKSSQILLWLALACFAQAQNGGAPGGPKPGPSPYGSGEKPRLDYTGHSSPQNILSFGLTGETAYDDNVRSDNRVRFGDAVFSLAGRLGFRQERKRLTFASHYEPGVQIYRDTPGLNVLNHGAGVDLNYQFTPRFALRARDSFSLMTGIFHPRTDDKLVPEMESPAHLNSSVITPLARTLENNARVDAVYQFTRRSSLDAFGGLLRREFLNVPANEVVLRNHYEANGGLQHLYRLDANTTIGTLYLLQGLHFATSHSTVHSGFFSLARRLATGTTLSIYGGPQYSRSSNRFTSEVDLFGLRGLLTLRSFHAGWHGAVGGSLVRESDRTAVQISARRTVTDGGGLLASVVTNTLLDVTVRQRIGRAWHASWNANASQSSAVLFDSEIRGSSMGLALERGLTEALSARLAYNFLHQRSHGPVPLLTDIDRNRVSFGLSYRVGAIALGR